MDLQKFLYCLIWQINACFLAFANVQRIYWRLFGSCWICKLSKPIRSHSCLFDVWFNIFWTHIALWNNKSDNKNFTIISTRDNFATKL